MKYKFYFNFIVIAALFTFSFVSLSGAEQWNKGAISKVDLIKADKATKDKGYAPGEILVKFKPVISQSRIASTHSALGTREINRIRPLKLSRVKIPPHVSMEEALAQYKMNPDIEYAEPNYIIHFEKMPNDHDFDELWGLHNTGQTVDLTTGTPDADIDAPEAWDITTGSDNVIIAVLDSGVANMHPDLINNRWVNFTELSGVTGVDDDGNGYIDDIYGWDFWGNDSNPEDYNSHGTHVAGTIAAQGDNGSDITGVNWDASIMPVRIGGVVGLMSYAVEGILYAVDNGAHIINASYGGSNFSQSAYNAIKYANNNDVLFVAAAGNSSNDNDIDPHYPSSYNLPNIIAVAATDQDDVLASFSNYGTNTVDVAAPGDNIYSTIPTFSYGPAVTLYTEDFDLFPTNWASTGTNNTWTFVSGTGSGGTNCLEDSPGSPYSNNTASAAYYSNPISSVRDNRYTLSFRLAKDLEKDYDFLYSYGRYGNSQYVDERRTDSGGFANDSFDLTFFAEIFPSFSFGFALVTDGSVTMDGVYIDDLVLTREPVSISGYNFDYFNGTSMATPHVAGIAGLVKAQNPNYSNSQIRDAILNTVDSTSGVTVSTGGRVNAFKAVTYLAPPKNIRITPRDVSVTLNWNANDESALTGYKILYGTDPALGTEISVGNVTSYTIFGLSNGTKYYFALRTIGNFPFPGPGVLEGSDTSVVTVVAGTPIVNTGGGGGGGGCFISTIFID